MTVITQGYGPSGSGSLVVTQGYLSGIVATAPAEQTLIVPAIARTLTVPAIVRTLKVPDPGD